MRIQEFCDEINAHNIPSCFRNRKGVKLTEWFSFLCLCAKTHVAHLTVLSYVSQHVRPPVAPQNKLQGFPLSSMSHNLRVMVLFDNSVTKVRDHRNVDVIMKPPKSFVL